MNNIMNKILKFIGNEKWENVKIVGINNDSSKIDTLLSSYDDLTDLFNCIELYPIKELHLIIGNRELDLLDIIYS